MLDWYLQCYTPLLILTIFQCQDTRWIKDWFKVSPWSNFWSHFILTFNSKNLLLPLINLVPRLGCKWEKVMSKAQKYVTGLNYNNNPHRKLHEQQVQIFCSFSHDFQYLLLLYYNFNSEVFLRLSCYFLPFATKLWNKVH